MTPTLAMAVGSLRPLGLPPASPFDLTHPPSVDSYRRLPDVMPLGRMVGNSAIVVLVAVPVTTLIASWAGFALAQAPRRRRRAVVTLTLACMVVPVAVLWIPRFMLYRSLGMLDGLGPLMAPALAATTPFTVLLSYRAFGRVPTAMWEAAHLEGASTIRSWWSVGLPLVRPTTAAVAAIAFAAHWGSYLDPLLYVQHPDNQTLAVGVAALRDLDASDAPITMAAAFLLTAVPLALLTATQGRLFHAIDR